MCNISRSGVEKIKQSVRVKANIQTHSTTQIPTFNKTGIKDRLLSSFNVENHLSGVIIGLL